jgi:putative acetyltransferase
MRASSPACSVHAMEAADLDRSGVRFFAVFDGDDAVAMGALKTIDARHGELKSMHVRRDRRGEGLADAVLAVLINEARALGLARVSLETGSQEAFATARAFYGRHGFSTCGPFEGYGPDPNSVFMTIAIRQGF